MKQRSILFSILTIIGLLAACSSTDQAPVLNAADSARQPDPSAQEGPNQDPISAEGFKFELPLQTVLTIGTLELEGTEYAVTSKQAAELLPLWIVLKNLLESETAATEEVDALTNQISETMTDAQMAYINSLDLGPQSSQELMEKLGLSSGFTRPENPEGEGNGGFQRPEGAPAGAGPGMGAGGGGGGLEVSSEQIESFQATREASGGGMGNRLGLAGNTMLIDALIELLQSK